MKRRLEHASGYLRTFVGSQHFLFASLFVFVLSSAWVATASLYPMAFDEEFHMGLIKLYSNHLLPNAIPLSRELAVFGIAGADPSYLFHYLMSFPYRFLILFLSADATVIVLRYMNIALMAGALVLYYKAARMFGASRAVSNLSILLFTLIPIAPLVAGQVNYDNLLLIVTAATLYLAGRIYRGVTQERHLPVRSTWLLMATLLVGAATKYAFIPLATGVILFLVVVYVNQRRHAKQLRDSFLQGSIRLPRLTKVLISIVLVVSALLCVRYVSNSLTYGNAVPSCNKVFDEEACLAYGPWQRDYYLEKTRDKAFQPLSLPSYITTHWLPGMSQRLTFAVSGVTNNYETKQPLPLLQIGLTLLTCFAAICLVFALLVDTRIRNNPVLWVTISMTLCYLAPLLWTLYKSYVTTSQPVAVNGRYLLPLLPFVTICLVLGMQSVLRRLRLKDSGPLLAVPLLLYIVVTGGGVLTYLILSEPTWFWNGWARSTHDVLQSAADFIVVR